MKFCSWLRKLSGTHMADVVVKQHKPPGVHRGHRHPGAPYVTPEDRRDSIYGCPISARVTLTQHDGAPRWQRRQRPPSDWHALLGRYWVGISSENISASNWRHVIAQIYNDCPLALATAGMNQRFTRYPPVINHNLGWCNLNWSCSPETVKLGVDLCDLDLWPLTLIFCMDITASLVIIPENVMMIQWWEHS